VEALTSWFLENKRLFPWREEKNPYKVWVSEVMLQQTRASVVVPYFVRWMERFPTLEVLANGTVEEVIKMWEGLGYYSRARNLHSGAKEVMTRFQGIIPCRKEDLETITGLGPYTVGAILSFGFSQKAVAIDGNVTRVISRYFAIEENVCKAKVRRLIEEKTWGMLDESNPWVTSEALIELGALVCTPKPLCSGCPLKLKCLAYQKGIEENLPIKNIREQTIRLKRWVIVLESDQKFLVQKEMKGKVMADLYQFPWVEKGVQLEKGILRRFGCKVKRKGPLKEVFHTFTKYKAHLLPILFQTDRPLEIEGWSWVCKEELSLLPFSSGHRAILQQLLRVS
jgi:A/G-specific adenine glycosylase